MRSRDEELETFFADHADRLERLVRARTRASDVTAQDACSHAWIQLVRRPDVRLGPGGFAWLCRVAEHEVWRLQAAERREPPVDLLADEPAPANASVRDDVLRIVEQRAALAVLRELPDRQRRILLMHAYGFRYSEIARMTGATVRTVERQLRRAREHLRDGLERGLAQREHEVLCALVEGLSLSAIALELEISELTARDYLTAAYRKLGARTRAEAIDAFHAAKRR